MAERQDIQLIIHADDVGMAPSVDRATFRAIEAGHVTSASVMVPCPSFAEVVAWAVAHPAADLGLHLTFTSDAWARPGWGPLSDPDLVPSLVRPDGAFWPDADAFRAHARPEEVEIEAVAQISAAIAAGLRPTHLDSHMFALGRSTAMAAVLRRVSGRFRIPRLDILRRPAAPGDPLAPAFAKVILLDLANEPPGDHVAWARRALDPCRPGLNELIVHCAEADDGLRALMGGPGPFRAEARQRDVDLLTSDAFAAELAAREIRLVSWRELQLKIAD
ncbi:MAG: ChbG/HpnK family deacetylase [Vicinamibacterales bacterium]